MNLWGLVVMVVMVVSCSSDERKSEAPPKQAEVSAPVVPAIVDDPIFGADSVDSTIHTGKELAIAVKLEEAGARAVYTRCSNMALWRGTVRLEGTRTFKSKRSDVERVNVSVNVADKTKVGGHTLWYMVTFNKAGVPAEITPQKQVSADACNLYPDIATPL